MFKFYVWVEFHIEGAISDIKQLWTEYWKEKKEMWDVIKKK